jgi:hypothetical protein
MVITGTNTFERDWADRALPDISYNSTTAKVAWEDLITLANVTNTDIWINIPAHATADYIQQLGLLLVTNLNPNLNVYVEPSDEIWNTASAWLDGTSWIAVYPHTKYTVTCSAGNPIFTCPGHGFTVGTSFEVRIFASGSDELGGMMELSGDNWELSLGNIRTLHVVDANTFTIDSAYSGLSLVPGLFQTKFYIAVRNQFVEDEQLYVCQFMKDIITNLSIHLPKNRMKCVMGTQFVWTAKGEARINNLATLGIQQDVPYLAVAPYCDTTYVVATVTCNQSSGSITPNIAVNSACTVNYALYLATNSPTSAQIIAGTGAITTGSFAGPQPSDYSPADYHAATSITGLDTTGTTQYKMYFWINIVATIATTPTTITKSVTPMGSMIFSNSGTSTTPYCTFKDSDYEAAYKLGADTIPLYWMALRDLMPSTMSMVCYEGGQGSDYGVNADLQQAMLNFYQSPYFTNAFTYYIDCLSRLGCALYMHYTMQGAGSSQGSRSLSNSNVNWANDNRARTFANLRSKLNSK